MSLNLFAKLLLEKGLFFGRKLLISTGLKASKKIKTIAVDLDDTLLNFNTPRRALELSIGKEETDKVIKNIKSSLVKTGDLSKANLLYYDTLKGVYKKEFDERLIKEAENHVNMNLVRVLKNLKKNNYTVLIVTKSNETIAKYFAKKYGFDAGIGTRLKYDSNGVLVGGYCLVGEENAIKKWKGEKIKFRTKISLVQDFVGKKIPIVMLTDDYFDIKALKESNYGIVLKPKKLKSIQKIIHKFKLYDKVIPVENLEIPLRLLIKFPKTRRSQKKLEKAVKKINRMRIIIKKAHRK